jgi:GMP synthase-like glutamine amidotransferase
MEHESVVKFPCITLGDDKRITHLGKRTELKFRFEKITGMACVLQHYTQITEKKLQEWNIRALLLSGCGTAWDRYDFSLCQELFRIIRAGNIPIMGLCGGHQFIGYAYGIPSVPLGLLPEGNKDPLPGASAVTLKEHGFTAVNILHSDPLFEGLDNKSVFWQNHKWGMKEVPPGFTLLASNEMCRIQAIRHKTHLVYGVQFHPEAYTEEHGDGMVLLMNFFRMARVI